MTADVRPSFTPGPWEAERDDDLLYVRVGNKAVALVANGKTVEGTVADARLIAAAPELYEALRELCFIALDGPCFCSDQSIIDGHERRCLIARAALAKADGR